MTNDNAAIVDQKFEKSQEQGYRLHHIVTVKVIKMEFAPSEKAGNGNILLTV